MSEPRVSREILKNDLGSIYFLIVLQNFIINYNQVKPVEY